MQSNIPGRVNRLPVCKVILMHSTSLQVIYATYALPTCLGQRCAGGSTKGAFCGCVEERVLLLDTEPGFLILGPLHDLIARCTMVGRQRLHTPQVNPHPSVWCRPCCNQQEYAAAIEGERHYLRPEDFLFRIDTTMPRSLVYFMLSDKAAMRCTDRGLSPFQPDWQPNSVLACAECMSAEIPLLGRPPSTNSRIDEPGYYDPTTTQTTVQHDRKQGGWPVGRGLQEGEDTP